jgi:hypothetical protein
VIAAVAVSVKEHEEEVAEEKAEQADTANVVSDATAQALTQAPLALLGALFTAPGGALTALGAARLRTRSFSTASIIIGANLLLNLATCPTSH